MAKYRVSQLEAAAAVELNDRRNMAIRIFRPQAHQEEIFKTPRAKYTLITGGNRCFAADSMVATPSGPKYACDIRPGDAVLGCSVGGIHECVVVANHEFESTGLTIVSRSGKSTTVTEEHLFLTPRGDFVEARSLKPGDAIVTVEDGKPGEDSVESITTAELQKFYAIGTSTETIIADGFAGHNSGKTTCSVVKFVSIAMDIPVTLNDGTECDMRMPWQKNRKLTMWICCDGQDHIGQTIWRVMCQPGLFRIVHDPVTKELRAFNPETDKKSKSKPSPPLLPKKWIKHVAWEERAKNVFDKITVHDPATGKELADIYAYSTKAPPKQGDPTDLIWVDEKIAHREGYIGELKGRLVDAGNGISDEGSGGQMYWSSWPSEDSNELIEYDAMIKEMIEKGEHDLGRKITLPTSDNKHLDKKAIREFLAGLTPEEALARDKGQFTGESIRMYPLFDKVVHSAIVNENEDLISKALRARDGIPPNEWTKYLALDPGTSHPAVLLCAVPPPEFGVDVCVAYQEFYPGRADPRQLATFVWEFAHKEKLYRMIIDKQAGQQQTIGAEAGTKIVDAYKKAFSEAGFTCYRTKDRFDYGSNDVGGRQLILNDWMHTQKNGHPKLRIVTHRCPELCKQLHKVRKKKVQKEVVDERKARGQHDIVDCLEYIAASNPRYVYVKPTIEDASPAYQRYMNRFGNGPDQQKSISIGTFY